MKTPFLLIADDFGHSNAVNDGIRELLLSGRLSGTSCLVNGDNVSAHIDLAALCLGLHLNFTLGAPLSTKARDYFGQQFPSLKAILLKSFLRVLPPDVVKAEVRAQCDKFEDLFNKRPDFIDGHQHVQQFPIIRDALLAHNKTTYLRLSKPAIGNLKSFIIAHSGAKPFAKILKQHKLQHNIYFDGLYPFADAVHYRQYFLQWLQNLKPNTLIMCHPGKHSHDLADPLCHSREYEYAYLGSDAFVEDLKHYQASLALGVPSP